MNEHGLESFVAQISPAAVFSLDKGWMNRRADLLMEHPGEVHLALPPEETRFFGSAEYYVLEPEDGLSLDPKKIRGTNSGHGALNLAVLKGAKKIHLVGFDLDPRENFLYRQWAEKFRSTLSVLDRIGIDVVNHNPDSFIRAFRFA